MYKNKALWINILLGIWQLPQILLGLLLVAIFHNHEVYTNPYNHISVWVVHTGKWFGTACFSSGPVICVCDGARTDIYLHETGHSKQSIYLGWLFHIVVSIPSICRFWIKRWFKKDSKWYHSGYPENWADKLGGVVKYTIIR